MWLRREKKAFVSVQRGEIIEINEIGKPADVVLKEIVGTPAKKSRKSDQKTEVVNCLHIHIQVGN